MLMEDEKDTDRRYMDALNILNEGIDFRKGDSLMMALVAVDISLVEQLFDSMSKNQGFWYVFRLKKLMILIDNSVHCLCVMICLQVKNQWQVGRICQLLRLSLLLKFAIGILFFFLEDKGFQGDKLLRRIGVKLANELRW